MPMSLSEALETFQSSMNSMFHNCIDNYVDLYIGNLLINSASYKDHLHLLEAVLSHLKEQELYVGSLNVS